MKHSFTPKIYIPSNSFKITNIVNPNRRHKRKDRLSNRRENLSSFNMDDIRKNIVQSDSK